MRSLLTISLALWLAAEQPVTAVIDNAAAARAKVREADNEHDGNAIRVEWRGHKLGYVPRAENRAVAAAMDHGDKLVARIAKLTEHANPWRRVEFEVFVEL